MLCLYLSILAIWKGILCIRRRRRSKNDIELKTICEKDVIENDEKREKKKCSGKHFMLGLVQFILISGTMTFFIYMINERTEKSCGQLEIPDKWKCQFNHFFNTNHDEKVNQHFNCQSVTNKTYEENLNVIHGYASNMSDKIKKVLNVKKSHSPLLALFENKTKTTLELNSTISKNESNVDDKSHLPKMIQNEVKSFLYIIHKIGNSPRKSDFGKQSNKPTSPAIVTAMSDENISEGKAFLKNVVRKIYPLQDIQRLVIYDFGLSKDHIDYLTTKCSFCEIRVFPFKKFGNLTIHYALKPLMIGLSLEEFKTVIWADPYIRFQPVYLSNVVKSAQKYGIQAAKNYENVRITNHDVRRNVIKYLEEETCMDTFDEIQSKFLVFSEDRSAYDIVLPWIQSSVGYGEMLKENVNQHAKSIYNPVEETILDIILNRLYNRNMSSILMDMNDYVYIDKHVIYNAVIH
ncbi:uncharacterized protein LOC127725791 [Mytilus californianus]|uniref:uncharacterized protein LOC127725791 n=1 Tax=Mytilus californianus TaxID=6549 RepID=UPI0022463E0B|nr:uncharacterized protein LOC127725791 [Mytilus californianus]